jgi:hypothetical protein
MCSDSPSSRSTATASTDGRSSRVRATAESSRSTACVICPAAVRASAARLDDGSTVRHLRSILIPGDETCLHLVEADSLNRVAEAFEQIGLDVDRIVEAVGLQAPVAGNNLRRNR